MVARWNMAAGAVLASFCFLLPAARAEESVKVGFVDMQRALNQSSVGQQALERLKQLMETKKAELEQEKALVEKKKEELDKQGLLLNEATRREREDEIRLLERNHTRHFSDTKEEIAREEANYTEQIRTELLKLVTEIGREEGYLLILEKQFSAILYAPDSIDMTDSVIERYDARKNQ